MKKVFTVVIKSIAPSTQLILTYLDGFWRFEFEEVAEEQYLTIFSNVKKLTNFTNNFRQASTNIVWEGGNRVVESGNSPVSLHATKQKSLEVCVHAQILLYECIS